MQIKYQKTKLDKSLQVTIIKVKKNHVLAHFNKRFEHKMWYTTILHKHCKNMEFYSIGYTNAKRRIGNYANTFEHSKMVSKKKTLFVAI